MALHFVERMKEKKWGNAPLRMSAPASSEHEKAVNGNVGLLCCRQLLIGGGGVFFFFCFGCMRPLHGFRGFIVEHSGVYSTE